MKGVVPVVFLLSVQLLSAGFVSGKVCPGPDQNIADLVLGFSRFAELTETAGLTETLSDLGPLNVFVPTTSAFEALAARLDVDVDELLSNVSLSQQIVNNHIQAIGASCNGPLNGTVSTLLPGSSITVDGNTVTDGSGARATVVFNVSASNGHVYVIDRVLLPSSPARLDVQESGGSSSPPGGASEVNEGLFYVGLNGKTLLCPDAEVGAQGEI
ncbi:hypothetical protein M9435_002858 [Picochlorum sp. BPE23]|nr:hypothetical protein M9435_002858 [Picochlorum sp. BPE23]